MLLQLGDMQQMVVLVGYVPHDLKYVVNTQGNYQMKFNIRTFDSDGMPVLVQCMAFKETALRIYDQFEKNDSIVIWGEIKHRYLRKCNDTTNYVKVRSFSIVSEIDLMAKDGTLKEEKQIFLEKCARKFDDNAPEPTDEEIKNWRKVYKKKYGGK